MAQRARIPRKAKSRPQLDLLLLLLLYHYNHYVYNIWSESFLEDFNIKNEKSHNDRSFFVRGGVHTYLDYTTT